MAPGGHAFRNHDTAPHAMQAVLDLSGNAGALRRPDGTEIARFAVPADLLAADIPPPMDETRPLRQADFDGLEICAAADFTMEGWNSPFHARRLMLDFNAKGLSFTRPLVLLPWNLANPASCVPDLAEKYLRVLGDASGQAVLLPFNAAGPVAAPVTAFVERLARQNPAAPKTLLIARVTGMGAANLLRRLGATSWLDGLDPEAAWTQARLDACGIPVIRLTGQTERMITEVLDAFGRRAIPARDVAALTRERPAPTQKRRPFQAGAFAEFLSQILAKA
jgi:hypothetical protein